MKRLWELALEGEKEEQGKVWLEPGQSVEGAELSHLPAPWHQEQASEVRQSVRRISAAFHPASAPTVVREAILELEFCHPQI